MNYEHITDQGGVHIIVDVAPVGIRTQTSNYDAAAAIVADYQLHSFWFNNGGAYLKVEGKAIKAETARRSGFEDPLKTARELKETAEKYLGELLDRYYETRVFLRHIQSEK